MLSEELTSKQQELQKAEREKLSYERELMMLRPLKQQLENYSASTQLQIENNVKVEHENNRLHA